MKRKLRKVISIILSLTILLSMLTFTAIIADASEIKTNCDAPSFSNIGGNNYVGNWARISKSYISDVGDGTIMKAQVFSCLDDDGNDAYNIYVEYLDENLNFLKSDTIAGELPIFGGFYENEDYYFVLSGQENPDESGDVEVFRITKYDKSWNKLHSAALYGSNTTIPFHAGTARFAQCENYLIIRTCHEMYASSDGLNHQANVTIQCDIDTMEITQSFTGILNDDYGYVSHSFNQFVQVEDNKLVAVDHGDAYPRSVVLMKYSKDLTQGAFFGLTSNTDIIEIPGEEGENFTGTTVGGFEISDTSYIVAGSMQNDLTNESGKTKNIYLATVSKEDNTVSVNMLTDFEEGEETATNPYLVKIADNSYMLIWSRAYSVYYTKIDGNGNQVGEIYSMEGELSDCVPAVIDNELVWYTSKYKDCTFYSINLDDISQTNTTVLSNGHHYEYIGNDESNENAVLRCYVCDDEKTMPVPTDLKVLWGRKRENSNIQSYSSIFVSYPMDSETIIFSVDADPDDAYNVFNASVSDESVAQVTMTGASSGELKLLKPGTVTLYIVSVCNPDLTYEKTFEVYKSYPEATDSDGDGYYEIDSSDDLGWFSTQVNSGKNTSVKGKITADFSMENESYFTPIGRNYYFKGELDGCGHTISNLTLNSSTAYAGLVCYTSADAVIKDINLKDADITGYGCVGGICASNNGTITGCTVSGKLSSVATSKSEYLGGICGANYGTVSKCVGNAEVVNNSTSSNASTGGISGCNSSGTISNCIGMNSVSSKYWAGGICGGNFTGTISNCYGICSSLSAYYKFGVVAYNEDIVSDCYSLTTPIYNNGGTVTNVATKSAEQFASGEVACLLQGEQTEEIWGQTLGTDLYPVLGGEKVYYGYKSCADTEKTYSNTSLSEEIPSHDYVNNVCSVCGELAEGIENGDVTLDGVLDIKDATEISKYLVVLCEFSDVQIKLADVDGDDYVTIKDATYIQKKLAGFIE